MFSRNKESGSEGPALPGSGAAVNNANANVILQELAVDYMRDKRIRRRWRIAFMLLVLLYLFSWLLLGASAGGGSAVNRPHTALVELNGIIGTEVGVSSDQINQSLRKAFEAKAAKGVVLRINSPGGTPVQSAEINSEIRRLRELYPAKPIHTVVSDLAASGGYFVAVATDQIYANRSSIVGSIGVRMDGFGFVEAMKKYGIERRSLTAGENKAILDPFLPVKPEQKEHAEAMLDQVHQHFIEAVKEGRGERISKAPEIYSGLFWSGQKAKELGLVDDFASLDDVARDVIGAEEIVNYTQQPSILEQISREFGVAVGVGVAKVLGGSWSIR
jgi:protease-4